MRSGVIEFGGIIQRTHSSGEYCFKISGGQTTLNIIKPLLADFLIQMGFKVELVHAYFDTVDGNKKILPADKSIVVRSHK